jgi:hypothetical protein
MVFLSAMHSLLLVSVLAWFLFQLSLRPAGDKATQCSLDSNNAIKLINESNSTSDVSRQCLQNWFGLIARFCLTLWYRTRLLLAFNYYTPQCPESRLQCRCLVVASNGGRSLPLGSGNVLVLIYQILTARSQPLPHQFWLQLLTCSG